MSYAPSIDRPFFNTPVRWTLRVLAWLAFFVAAYLAWHAVNQSSVAGCGVGAANSCDMVLSSRWARWLGIPVAVVGLACYATLAGLSVALDLRDERVGRWINMAFVMFATVAAGASLWFIAIQIVAIGSFCIFCVVTDLCGIALGALALWSTVNWWRSTPYTPQPRRADAGLMALRGALPTGNGPRPIAAAPVAASRSSARPPLMAALGGAAGLLALLIAGQLIFPSKTYSLHAGNLSESIELTGTDGSSGDLAQSSSAQTHVAMRITAEPDGDAAANADQSEQPSVDPEQTNAPVDDSASGNGSSGENSDASSETDPPTEDAGPRAERLVKFLGGKLTLDVYKHPLLGSPDAPHVMIELVSYDCPHCRKMHSTMEKGIERYGSQLAIIVMPVPLEKDCNKLIQDSAASHRGACATARYALGIANLRPHSFHKFHNWLMSGDKKKPPALEKIIPKAYDMVDRERLRAFTHEPKVNKQIAEYVDLFARLRNQPGTSKEFGLPVQILGDKVMSGVVEKEKDVFAAWEEHLGVKAR